MLQNIQQLHLEECLDYIKRLAKLYFFFFVLYLVLLFVDGAHVNASERFALAVLYIMGMLAQSIVCYMLTEKPSVRHEFVFFC
jgi:hypothetical protein